MSIFTLNGMSDDDLGLSIAVGGTGALWSTPQVEREGMGLLDRIGVVPSALATGVVGRLPLTLVLDTTVTNRRATFNTIMAHLDGMLRFELNEAPGFMQWGYLSGVPARPRFDTVAFQDDKGALLLDFDLILAFPQLFSKVPSVIGVSSTPAKLVGLGTLPCQGVFYFGPTTTDLTITYKHGITRETLNTLTLSGSTAAGLVLEVRSFSAKPLWTWSDSTGARVNVLDTLWSSGNFPTFYAGHGDANNPPLIESNHTGELHYRGVTA